ncbi:MAG: Ig-like domain-containing protein [Wujia sp.]
MRKWKKSIAMAASLAMILSSVVTGAPAMAADLDEAIVVASESDADAAEEVVVEEETATVEVEDTAYAALTYPVVIADAFPNAAFQTYVKGFDTDSDGSLSQSEAEAVTTIEITNKDTAVNDLTGIQYFTNLTKLDCSGNALRSLDVSNLTKLEFLYCQSNLITNLDLSKNAELTMLVCSSNEIATLDLSQNAKLSILLANEMAALKELIVSDNAALTILQIRKTSVSTMALKNASKLVVLDCSETNIPSLDASKLTSLRELYCVGMTGMSVLDVSGLANLKVLVVGAFKTDMQVVKDSVINDKYIYDYVSNPDIMNAEVEYVLNNLTSIWVGGNTKGSLTEVIAKNCPSLEYVRCNNNNIQNLDLSGDSALKYLNCENNSLKEVSLTGLSALQAVNASNNVLTGLDVSGNVALKELYLEANKLSALDVTANTVLEALSLTSNELESTVTVNSEKEYISQDVSKNTALKALFCSKTGIEYLGLDTNVALEELVCESNHLTSLNLGNCTALKTVNATNNKYDIVLDETFKYKFSDFPGFQRNSLDETLDQPFIGATYEKGWIIWPDLDKTSVSYSYAMNEKYKVNFTLNIVNPLKPVVYVGETAAGFTGANNIINGSTYSLRPVNKATTGEEPIEKVTWTTDNDKVLEIDNVNSSMKVIGLPDTGTVNLKMHIDGKERGYVQFKINQLAEEIAISGTSGSGETLDLTQGVALQAGTLVDNKDKTMQITATLSPETTTNKKAYFTSSDSRVATVDSTTGKVTAVGQGTAVITCIPEDAKTNPDNIVKATVTVNVTQRANTVAVTNANGSNSQKVAVGQQITYKATVAPSNVDKAVTWTTSDASVATVDENGVITGMSKGTATITATSKDFEKAYGTRTVDVVDAVSAITISTNDTTNAISTGENAYTIQKGKSVTFLAAVAPAEAEPTVTWTTSDDTVATVSNGIVSGRLGGDVVITATANDGSGTSQSINIHVNAPVTGINVRPATGSTSAIAKGATTQLEATVGPTDASDKRVEWSSENTAIATVDANGLVTAVEPGSVKIYATAKDGSGKVGFLAITVQKPVESILLTANNTIVYKNSTLAITPTVSPADAANKTVEWTSSNPEIATVDAGGRVVGKKSGTVTITATAKDKAGAFATFTVTVVTPVASIKLTSAKNYVNVGKTMQIAAEILPADADNKTLAWSSTNEKIATVDGNGVVRGVSAGNVQIKATSTDGSNRAVVISLTVKQPVTKITLKNVKKKTVTSTTMNVGASYSLVPSISPSTATDKTLTWKTSNKKLATVSNGVITALKKGTVTITCTANDGSGVKKTFKVTIKQPVKKIALKVGKKTVTSVNVKKGKTKTVKAYVSPSYANNKKVTFKSADKKIATVTSTGKIKGIRPGRTTITCTAKDGSKVYTAITVSVE